MLLTNEKIIRVGIIEDEWTPNLLVQIGHIIGTQNRPISFTSDGCITFPIDAETESVKLFEKLFSKVIHKITLDIEEKTVIFSR
tara:strand:+ start:741 stop:992 length:252 start_codon:yes stop_codon:yes gene_type:complete